MNEHFEKAEELPAVGSPVDRGVSRRATNGREPKPAMVLRLLAEAQAGVKCDMTLVQALEFRREQYGLNKRDFAALLGFSLARYSDVCSGRRRLPLDATKRAYAIGVPADALLQW